MPAKQCPDPEAVVAYVGHDMGAQARADIALHLDECESCRQVVALAALCGNDSVSEGGGARRFAGRYRIIRLIDAGGMGLVYEAEDPQLGRRVAVKMLHGEGNGHQLRREARALAALHHPNVVRVYDVGSVDQRDYIVMELLERGTLAQWLATTQRSHSEVLSAFGQIANGLGAVHAIGLVHRDFKPSNVLLRSDGSFAVTDFGLSTHTPTAITPVTPVSGLHHDDLHTLSRGVGTPAYMAPEQTLGERATIRSDLYSFAVCMLEALHGAPTTVDAVAELPIPRAARKALAKALATQPGERFVSVAAFWRAFAGALRGRARRGVQFVAVATLVGLGALVTASRVENTETNTSNSADASSRSAQPATADLELRERIDLAEDAAMAGDYPKAIEILDSVVRIAKNMPGERALARALRWRGRLTTKLGRHEDGFKDTEWAYRDAVAKGIDVEAALAVTQLVFIASNYKRQDMAKWLATADATVARLGISTNPQTHRAVLELRTERVRASLLAEDFERAIAHVRESTVVCGELAAQVFCGELRTLEASALRELARYPEAYKALEQASEAFLKAGREHSDTYADIFRLKAVIADAQGHHDDAIELLKQAQAAYEALKTPSPSGLARVRESLGRTYSGKGNYAAAIATLLSLLNDSVPPIRAQARSVALSSLARAYIESEQSELALRYVERALLIRQSLSGSDSQDWALVAAVKGRALAELARTDESVKVYDAAIEVLERSFGADTPKPAWVRQLRAAALAKRDAAASKQELERSITIFSDSMGADSPYVGAAYEDLAVVEALLGNIGAAREALRRAIEVHDLTGGPDHPARLRMQRRLAELSGRPRRVFIGAIR